MPPSGPTDGVHLWEFYLSSWEILTVANQGIQINS